MILYPFVTHITFERVIKHTRQTLSVISSQISLSLVSYPSILHPCCIPDKSGEVLSTFVCICLLSRVISFKLAVLLPSTNSSAAYVERNRRIIWNEQNKLDKAGGPNKSSQCYVKIICLFLCNHALDLVKNGIKLKIFQYIFDL